MSFDVKENKFANRAMYSHHFLYQPVFFNIQNIWVEYCVKLHGNLIFIFFPRIFWTENPTFFDKFLIIHT